MIRSLFFLLAASLVAQDVKYDPEGQQIPGPPSKADTAAWLDDVKVFRAERRVRAGLTSESYEHPELKWTQSSFIQPQSMVEDRYFYDPSTRKYTVDRFLADLNTRYGGIDSVLLWPVYPNIGIDNRNQFDLLRDMPGGIAGLREMVSEFHKHGVRVLFPTMPWDTGTREEPLSKPETIAKLAADIGFNGINGDTFHGLPRTYRTASDKTGHPVALEPELYPSSDEMLNWDTMSWGYWKYPFVPMISLGKWLEPRHMVNVCNRWARNRANDLQYAFFNGTGYESWENVWSIWNGITPRDGEAIRRIAKIERQFASLLVSQDWTPHASTAQYGVFASRFPSSNSAIWTIVNRNPYNVDGVQLQVAPQSSMRYFDLWHGIELHGPDLAFSIEANGYGAILEQSEAPDARLQSFLDEMRALAAHPLSSFSNEWTFLPQQLVPIKATPAATDTPEGMVKIPEAKNYEFVVSGVEIEGDNEAGVDVQYPWENSPRRHHRHSMDIAPFLLDKYPVTNRDFQHFLEATHYHPADDHNFLRDWKNGTFPAGWENKPVTWVSLEDARAYAKWAGKRLPREWEWQYAAQGMDGRKYPWGNTWEGSRIPASQNGHTLEPPAEVTAHPSGASPFGVEDLTGNIWQWTDEFTDEHTRTAIVRGGSSYRPSGSNWYFPLAYSLREHGKYLLMAPSKDRAGTLGFRCAKDVINSSR